MECTPAALQAAQSGWQTLQQAAQTHDLSMAASLTRKDCDAEIVAQFEQAMDADFNAPAALALLFGLAKKLKHWDHEKRYGGATSEVVARNMWQTFVYLAQNVFGFAFSTMPASPHYPFGEEIAKLVQERQKARQAKNYAEADRIRQELAKKGFRLIDKPNGETLVEVVSE
jgi:cysteinyl-tRNA synthetase